MRHPVMNEEGHTRIVDQVEGLFGGRVGGHDDDWTWVEGGRG